MAPVRHLFQLTVLLVCASAPYSWGQTNSATLGFDTANYFYAPSSSRQSVFPSLQADLQGSYQSNLIEASGSIESRFLLLPNNPVYFEAPEAYLASSQELGPIQVSIGRRPQHWSSLDETWQLGIWQPRYRWDYLSPSEVGLTGAFLNVDAQWIKIVGFLSPLFIPERGIPITAQNGQLTSPSPWFLAPPSSFTWLNTPTSLHQEVVMPEVSSVILHPSGAASVRLGQSMGPFVSGGYALAPMNQLMLGIHPYLGVDTYPNVGEAKIYPRVVYHQLASLEAGYISRPWSLNLSGLGEVPIRDSTDSRWLTQEANTSIAVATTLSWKFSKSEHLPSQFQLSYLRQWGGNAPDQGPHSSELSVFDDRYPFQSALQMGLESLVIEKLALNSKLVLDLGHEGMIFSTEIRYRPQKSWVVGLGADLLGSMLPDGAPEFGSDFISKYIANDRVHAGVSYVF